MSVYCFPDCPCSCGDSDHEFNDIIARETSFPIRLDSLVSENIGWVFDKSLELKISEGLITASKNDFGVYFLWHKEDCCCIHQPYHMKALYVGKGAINARLISHLRDKDFSEEVLVYFSYLSLPNRQAKYVEQLILDVYDIPHNNSENTGNKRLCAYWDQSQVD
jgi:hypothetical protein